MLSSLRDPVNRNWGCVSEKTRAQIGSYLFRYNHILGVNLSLGKGGDLMATNTGNGYRKGSIDNRSQTYNPQNGTHVKRDTTTGRFMDVKSDGTPFKGVAKEPDGRRS